MHANSPAFRLLAAGLAGLMLAYGTVAWAGPQGTVVLKNGGRIHGELMEVLPDEYVTVKLPDGTVRRIDWERVENVKEAPAAASQPGPRAPVAPPPPPAPATPPPAPGGAVVVVRSTKQGATVGEVLARHSFATVAFVNGRVAPGVGEGISWRNICVAPCRFELTPGVHDLVVDGVGIRRKVAQFDLEPGVNRLLVEPGDQALWVLGFIGLTLGLTSLLLGVIGFAVGVPQYDSGSSSGYIGSGQHSVTPDWALGATLGGLGVSVLGIWGMVAGSTSFGRDVEPPQRQTGTAPRAPALRVATSF